VALLGLRSGPSGRNATVKQQLAAIRMLSDYLVVGQIVPHNPAHAVKGPRHSTARGKTRMPTRDEAKALLASISTTSLVACATAP
jgi:site-specific recombinase XerC